MLEVATPTTTAVAVVVGVSGVQFYFAMMSST
jgi:hypothetical protein